MKDISHQRCYNHEFREAVAVCLECSRYFCRECVTEHEDRVICAACLEDLLKKSRFSVLRFSILAQTSLVFLGIITLWVFFYYMGQLLIETPVSFHEGTLWSEKWWE